MTDPPSPGASPFIHERVVAPGVLRWTLDNPSKRNAVHPDALAWISARARALSGEVVLLTGAGERAFSAGFDLSALPQALASSRALPDQPLIDACDAMQAADASFVAVLNGYVIGAGVELACACALRIARAGVWFQVPAARLGVVYHARGLQRFRAVFGPGLVRRLMLLGDRLSAEEVLAVGGLARLVEGPDELERAATELATRLREASPRSTRGHRAMLLSLERDGAPDAARLAEHEARRREAYAARGGDD
ncbi:MAG: enoyl-CoA hydratase/isomerase family protein [Myxococcales bacterium]|nr:enoyl-CoA hydratase/isomerase family protein [Myxococcales bacterium]MCB9755258.1 enoyl-CoA hydratase/isomerase family protein [Myxococcales bacterium]